MEYTRFNTVLLSFVTELCNVYPTHKPFQTFFKQMSIVTKASVQTPLLEFKKALVNCDARLVAEDDEFFLAGNNSFVNSLRLDTVWATASGAFKAATWAYLHKLAYIAKTVEIEPEGDTLNSVMAAVTAGIANGDVDTNALEAVATGTGTEEQQLRGMKSIMNMARGFMK